MTLSSSSASSAFTRRAADLRTLRKPGGAVCRWGRRSRPLRNGNVKTRVVVVPEDGRQPIAAYVGDRRSEMSTPSAVASRSTLSRETFLSQRSIEPTYVRCSSARSARASCDRPCAARSVRKWRATRSLADWTVTLRPDMAGESSFDDFRSTDLK